MRASAPTHPCPGSWAVSWSEGALGANWDPPIERVALFPKRPRVTGLQMRAVHGQNRQL